MTIPGTFHHYQATGDMLALSQLDDAVREHPLSDDTRVLIAASRLDADERVVQAGNRTYDLQNPDDLQAFLNDIEDGKLDGVGGGTAVVVDGTRVLVGDKVYDLATTEGFRLLMQDSRDGTIDGRATTLMRPDLTRAGAEAGAAGAAGAADQADSVEVVPPPPEFDPSGVPLGPNRDPLTMTKADWMAWIEEDPSAALAAYTENYDSLSEEMKSPAMLQFIMQEVQKDGQKWSMLEKIQTARHQTEMGLIRGIQV